MKVSAISFGNWMTGDTPNSEQSQIELIKLAYEKGVNYFDTSESYGQGVGEILMGKAIKALNCNRSDLVISTKLFWGKSEKFSDINCTGLSRKHLVEGMKESLQRLQMDYVDIVYCHRYDLFTDIEEVCRTMSWIVDQGYSHYWGTSEWPASRIAAAIEICKFRGYNKPVIEQSQYNMISRNRVEKEYRDIIESYKYGVTAWSPLACGLLTGRYNNGNFEESLRFTKNSYPSFLLEEYKKSIPNLFEKLNQLKVISDELGITQAQLAVLWVVANTDVTSCIVGASKANQLIENIEALKHLSKFTQEINSRVDQILGNQVDADFEPREFCPRTNRRDTLINN